MRPHHTAAQPTPELPPGGTRGRLVDPFEVTLAAGAAAPAAARAAVTAWMRGRVSEALRTDVLLLVSELVANSVQHADAPADSLISVRADIRADVLRLEVSDRGKRASIVRRTPGPPGGGGFGLNVVEALAGRWGVHRDAGTQVWVEVALPANG